MLEKITALYCRLSKDDGKIFKNESESIQNQRKMLMEYAHDKCFPRPEFYTDDGITGTIFDEKRQGYTELIEDCRHGKIGIVITIDLSRIGRDYLECGTLIEKFFPQYGVRYIAILENVDTNDKNQDYYFAAIKNWFNELYARDTSKKVRGVKRNKAERGEHVNGENPYGYIIDPDDKNHYLPDPETGWVVKRIFKDFVEGKSYVEIKKWLEEEKVYSPHNLKLIRAKRPILENPYIWCEASLRYILMDSQYLGEFATGKSYTASYKDRRRIQVPKEDWLIFKDTHEPLIDQETYDKATELIARRVHACRDKKVDILSGIFYCGDCGARMYSKKGQNIDPKHYSYKCGTYKNSQSICPAHQIRQSVILELLLKDIQNVFRYVLKNEEEFVKKNCYFGDTKLQKAKDERKIKRDSNK
jgi:DNA invertase Pin-like site-specific DNA recombinase